MLGIKYIFRYMKRLSCVVGFAFALGAVAPLVAEDLPSHIDVVIVSASSSSLENGGSSSSASQVVSSSASVAPASSASAKSSSSVKHSSSSRRSDDDSPLIPEIPHDSKAEGTNALPRSVSAPVGQGMDRWFDLQGRLLKGKPTAKGTYYHNGKAVVVK